MKKIFTIVMAVMMSAMTLSAKETKPAKSTKNYNHSVGMVAGLGLGFQYKGMVLDHFTIINEFGYFINPNGVNGGYGGSIDNLVLAYQAKAAEGQGIKLDWYVGGQIKLGYDASFAMAGGPAVGVFGFGAAAGIEAKMANAPIAFSFDFRPGYALQFTSNAVNHLMDYSLNLGVRYTF